VAGEVRLYPGALERLLTSPAGPVGRDLAKRAVRVESRAKSDHPWRSRTGRLQSSITWGLFVDGRGLYAAVGTNVFYAAFLELGTSRMPPYPFLVPALAAAA
jgi:HK97 gp10 family phage protein